MYVWNRPYEHNTSIARERRIATVQLATHGADAAGDPSAGAGGTFSGPPSVAPRAVLVRVSGIRALAVASLIGPAAAHATTLVIPVAVTTCSTCASWADLRNAAGNYWRAYAGGVTPPGYPIGSIVQRNTTIIYVVSTKYALSASFTGDVSSTGFGNGVIYLVNARSTPSDLGTIQYDGNIIARADKMPVINVDPTLKPNDTPELIENSINDQLHFTGVAKTSLWNGLFPSTVGQVVQGIFTYQGVTYTIWNNAPFTVRFSNGWTVQMTWTPGSGSPGNFQINWKSLKNAKGQPINLDGTLQRPGKPTGSTYGGQENLGTGATGPGLDISLWAGADPLPDGSVTVGEPIGGGGGSTPVLSWL